MYISLRESCTNGFKKWSGSQKQTYGNKRDTNEVNTIFMLDPDLGPSGMTSVGRRHRLSPPTTEVSL